MAKKKRSRPVRLESKPSSPKQPQVADPTQESPSPPTRRRGWRDPALILAIVGVVVAGLSALYARQQAAVSSQAFDRQIRLERQQALTSAADVLALVQDELRRCLRNEAAQDACGHDVPTLQERLRAAAIDPILTTDCPLVHMALESLDYAMTRDIDLAVEAARRLQRSLDIELGRGSEVLSGALMGPTRLRLALGANDLEADAHLAQKFGSR